MFGDDWRIDFRPALSAHWVVRKSARLIR